jgi:NDP-sugar pyrophosphorylase family protein
VVQWNGDNQISGYIEKPSYDYTVSMGIYVFEPGVMNYIPFNEYLDFPELVLKMIAAGERVSGYRFDGYWMDLGRPDDYAQAAEDFASLRSQFLPEE